MILRKIIPQEIKIFIKYILSPKTNEIRCNQGKKVFVMLGADYGNLGDCAITYAQIKYLAEVFPNYQIIEIPISKTYSWMRELKSKCTDEDIITIVGGGNTGDLYKDIEWCRQFVIKKFPENRIISFPQTVDFSNTARGRRLLKKAIHIYSEHKNLVLCAREKHSYDIYTQYFKNNKVILTPDIVLSIDKFEPQFKRRGIMLCLRNDEEKLIDEAEQQNMIKSLSDKYELSYCDTHIGAVTLDAEKREEELEKIWATFKKVECVITDRLHGMIFCAITKTPCVVLPNNNRKIQGVYEWIRDVETISWVCSITNVEKEIDRILKDKQNNIPEIKKEFEPLVKCLYEL